MTPDDVLKLAAEVAKNNGVNHPHVWLAFANAVRNASVPVAWQFFQDGKWHNGMDTHNHRENTEADGIATRNLYTKPQPATERSVDGQNEGASFAEVVRQRDIAVAALKLIDSSTVNKWQKECAREALAEIGEIK